MTHFNNTVALAEARAENKAGKLSSGKNVPSEVIRRLDVTEVAKLIRSSLRHHFAGYKFGVKSERFAGGTAIVVTYSEEFAMGQDRIRNINHLLRGFESVRLDSMTDSSSSTTSWLSPTGRMLPAYCGAFGDHPEVDNPNPADWELVQSGAKYITHHRR